MKLLTENFNGNLTAFSAIAVLLAAHPQPELGFSLATKLIERHRDTEPDNSFSELLRHFIGMEDSDALQLILRQAQSELFADMLINTLWILLDVDTPSESQEVYTILPFLSDDAIKDFLYRVSTVNDEDHTSYLSTTSSYYSLQSLLLKQGRIALLVELSVDLVLKNEVAFASKTLTNRKLFEQAIKKHLNSGILYLTEPWHRLLAIIILNIFPSLSGRSRQSLLPDCLQQCQKCLSRSILSLHFPTLTVG